MTTIETTPTTPSTPTAATNPSVDPVSVPPAVAIDLYRDIHKGIRAELFGTTLQAGDLDPSDRAARVALAGRVDALVNLLHTHAEHEDTHVQPAIEKVLPDAAARIVGDHDLLDRRIGDIHEMSVAFGATAGAQLRSVGQELYLELASFTSAYLEHQNLEERVVMPALAGALGPEAVLGIHVAIISSIPPADMAASLAIMIP
ncbi:MAG TPA: hemerythrin domain-containing protein, partial [Acidimicrobiales bacterium]